MNTNSLYVVTRELALVATSFTKINQLTDLYVELKAAITKGTMSEAQAIKAMEAAA
jgi:hypothetical protein